MQVSAAAPPSLSSLNFDVALTRGGASITITGANLGSATSCTVGGTSATITANTSTSLTFTMPAKTAGVYNVQVTTAGGGSNTLSIEAWSPAAEPSCTLFAEKPNYSATAPAGTWTASVGGNLSHASAAPSASSGEPVFNGTSNRLNSATNLDALMSATAGTVCVAVKPTANPATGNVYDNRLFVSNTGQSSFGMAFANFSGTDKFVAHIFTGGYHNARVAASVSNFHAVVARWSQGATIDLSVDGLNDLGAAGFTSSSIGTWSPTGGTLDVGGNYNNGNWFQGTMRAIAIFSTKLSDAVATKWNKVCRCEYGTP